DVGSGHGNGYTLNRPVPPYSGEDMWVPLLEHVVVPAARAFEPELILVSAGFDAHAADPLAMCELQSSSFRHMALHVRALAEDLGVPFGAVLEGGYDLAALSESVAATLEGFAQGGEPPSLAPGELTYRAAARVGRHWQLDLPRASAG